MSATNMLTTANDKTLFTPGPLTTSRLVKQAMLRDLGARDDEFLTKVKSIRSRLLKLAGVQEGVYEAVIMQGSGTFGLESVVGSSIPPDGKILVLSNGTYGRRIATIARTMTIETIELAYHEYEQPDLDELRTTLKNDPGITCVVVVHCETTSGIVNPIEEISEIVKAEGRLYFVDAMSSFGAMPINLKELNIDYMVSSANKCIEGVPGFCYILVKKDVLLGTKDYARSLSLDLYGQWKGWEDTGQFRYTPPVHALLAFEQALTELEHEGGVKARAARYRENYETLMRGMRDFGFVEYLRPEYQSHIIHSFLYPDSPNFSGVEFYNRLNDKNQVIYSGKVTDQPCFRIGTIGRITKTNIQTLLSAIGETLAEMSVEIPLASKYKPVTAC